MSAAMSCETFDSNLMDALYEELDEASGEATSAHAATCAACRAKLEKFQMTRRMLPSVSEPVPDGLEAKILAAAEAAMNPAIAAAPAPAAEGGAKIFRLFANPRFAIAAGFVLVLGAGLMFTQGMRKSAPAVASRAESEEARGATPTASAAASALALNEPAPPSPVGPGGAVVAATPPTELAASAAAGARKSGTHDPQFLAAKKLYDAGRFAEALPKFEALSPTHPEAELYVARCLVRTRGCSVAAAHFDSAATRNAGTESGSRASLEGARCYGSMGEAQAARTRYNALTDDAYVAPEARDGLAGLESDRAPAAAAAPRPAPAAAPHPVATAGTPTPAKHATPKAAAKPVDVSDAFETK